MVDTYKLAIADLIKHPKLGVVSHQPAWDELVSDTIHVRDCKGVLYTVLASECEYLENDEGLDYWKNYPKEVK